MKTDLVNKVKDYVKKIFDENALSGRHYHNFTHSLEVVKVTEEISSALKIDDKDKEALLIAAWFHDIGYTKCCDGHEDVGVELAKGFLTKNNYSEEGIDKVARLIQATRMPRNPKNLFTLFLFQPHSLASPLIETRFPLSWSNCNEIKASSSLYFLFLGKRLDIPFDTANQYPEFMTPPTIQ